MGSACCHATFTFTPEAHLEHGKLDWFILNWERKHGGPLEEQ